MSCSQPVTKEQLKEIHTEISSFCTEQKSASTSPPNPVPQRKIFRAQRRLKNGQRTPDLQRSPDHNLLLRMSKDSNNNDNYMDYDDAKFQKMTNEQYMDYQQSTMSKRMKKKRKFDVFSSGSNSSLYSILTNAETFRVPYYALFYVR